MRRADSSSDAVARSATSCRRLRAAMADGACLNGGPSMCWAVGLRLGSQACGRTPMCRRGVCGIKAARLRCGSQGLGAIPQSAGLASLVRTPCRVDAVSRKGCGCTTGVARPVPCDSPSPPGGVAARRNLRPPRRGGDSGPDPKVSHGIPRRPDGCRPSDVALLADAVLPGAGRDVSRRRVREVPARTRTREPRRPVSMASRADDREEPRRRDSPAKCDGRDGGERMRRSLVDCWCASPRRVPCAALRQGSRGVPCAAPQRGSRFGRRACTVDGARSAARSRPSVPSRCLDRIAVQTRVGAAESGLDAVETTKRCG